MTTKINANKNASTREFSLDDWWGVSERLLIDYGVFVFQGCAFVTYATKRSAANAIKALNQSKTLEVRCCWMSY